MTDVILDDILNLDAIKSLPNDAKNEVEKFVHRCQEEWKKKKSEYEKYRVDSGNQELVLSYHAL